MATEALNSLRRALIITRREVRDQFRDWRVIFPVLTLTVFFPGLMNFTAQQAVSFVSKYGAPIIAERLIPFLLMVVGFFPISFSLVIALESFVGEKERKSIEPLLSSPLSDFELYLGKLLAAMVPTLLASYLGITVYLIGIYSRVGWQASSTLLVQIILLTTVQAVEMVSGAVIVSSQTTSVRAANLLASFIIIPFALLVQGESIVMFWAQYSTLWWAIIAQVLIAAMLIRTGLAYFNREELLGRELDQLNLRWAWKVFRQSFVGQARSVWEWYRLEIPRALRLLRLPLLVSALAIGIGVYAGVAQARVFTLPAETLAAENMRSGFIQGLEAFRFISAGSVLVIWLQNLRVMALASLLGIFSFGVLGQIVCMLPLSLISYVAANIAAAGESPWRFLLAFVLPHGLLEIPAILIASASILSLGATFLTPAQGKTIGEAWLSSLGRWARLMLGVVLPLFLLAALVEVFITPHVVLWLFG